MLEQVLKHMEDGVIKLAMKHTHTHTHTHTSSVVQPHTRTHTHTSFYPIQYSIAGRTHTTHTQGTTFSGGLCIIWCRPYIYKSVGLSEVCGELAKLGSYGTGKIVMKVESNT